MRKKLFGGAEILKIFGPKCLGVFALVLKRGPVTSVLSFHGRCGRAVLKSETNLFGGAEILKIFGPKCWGC